MINLLLVLIAIFTFMLGVHTIYMIGLLINEQKAIRIAKQEESWWYEKHKAEFIAYRNAELCKEETFMDHDEIMERQLNLFKSIYDEGGWNDEW